MRLILAPLLLVAAMQAPEPPGRLVDVGGYRVHLYCTGAGSPTVMVVGAGFSFDWTLVQTALAGFTRICTYDVSGTAWSDRGPSLTCRARVDEVHRLVLAAQINRPFVLAGLSIGGCVARLYAAEHPAEVSGMVIVDHAFSPDPPSDAKLGRNSGLDSPPVLIYQAPIVLTAEDTSKFDQLPETAQQLHRWAMSRNPRLPTWDDAEDCLAELRKAERGPQPLGDMPLVVVSTNNQAPGYDRLQKSLLALSSRSRQMEARRSFHAVEIDEPEVVTAAIRRVVESVREK